MNLRPGIKLIEDQPGTGPLVVRHQAYQWRFRITLRRGDIVPMPGADSEGFFTHAAPLNRESFVGGIFQTVEGMRVGGYRKVILSPHMAYGQTGIPGRIPPNARLTVEVKVEGACQTE